MVNPIGSNISAIQLFSAANAFKSSMTSPIQSQPKAPEVSEGTEINDNNILKTQNVDEIKKFAQMAGENNLSEEDIKYGLSYGRSVIAEYFA